MPYGFFLEVKGKSLLQKTPCTSDIGSRGPCTGTDLKESSLKTSFHGTSYDAYEPAWKANSKGTVVTLIT